MKLPPADLLEQISGVEEGLRDNRKGGRVGGFGLAVSVLQVTVGLGWLDGDVEILVVVIGLALVTGSLALVARSRVWIRESSTPFRYTCSIAPFDLEASDDLHRCCEISTWLEYDLAEKLNERIRRRLSFLDIPRGAKEPPGEGTNEHIHITGRIVVRTRKDEKLWIEVAPRVRIGKNDQPATLAHSVPQLWEPTTRDEGVAISPTYRVEWRDYEKILERVYFNLASHIYRQIEGDIRHKITLLPGNYLRATAYLHEADDYGSSNTLDGLEYAIQFYRSAMALYDPCLRERPKGRVRAAGAALSRAESVLSRRLRRAAAAVIPKVARKETRIARAEVGLANALLHRRTLAGMSGRRLNTVYEAPHLTESAIRRLRKLPEDAPERQKTLFDAYVSRALAYVQLDSPNCALEQLEHAQSVIPSGYDQNPSYLYVQGLLEELPASAIRFLRLAVERQPRFEVARFELALKSEMLWRTRPTLEEKVARVILEEYDEVLKLNPGNIAASSHSAYIYWLLNRPDDASSYYYQGSEFKNVKPETTIGELDYGMARVLVEQGAVDARHRPLDVEDAPRPGRGHRHRPVVDDPGRSRDGGRAAKNRGDGHTDGRTNGSAREHDLLFRAYRHYIRAATAQLLLGVSDWKSTSAQFYFFDAMSEAMMSRYDCYYANAKVFLEGSCVDDSGHKDERRVRELVMSSVENDYGEACYSYYLRNYDKHRLRAAKKAFQSAKDKNRDAILPYYNCYLLLMHEGDWEGALEQLDQLRNLEPSWSDALLASIASYADAASRQISRRRGRDTRALEQQDLERSIREMLVGIDTRGTATKTGQPDRGDASVKPPRDVASDLRRLVPHPWLWSQGRNGVREFRWNVFSGRSARLRRWERELDELQVQAVFKWALARLIQDNVTHPEVRSGSGSAAEYVLSCLESRLWPGNFTLLFTLIQLDAEQEANAGKRNGQDARRRDRVRNLQMLVERWLRDSPTSYWALELVVTDFFDFRGAPLEVFEKGFPERALQTARHALQADKRAGAPNHQLMRWVDDELKRLRQKDSHPVAVGAGLLRPPAP